MQVLNSFLQRVMYINPLFLEKFGGFFSLGDQSDIPDQVGQTYDL